jgi:hypothetical protein
VPEKRHESRGEARRVRTPCLIPWQEWQGSAFARVRSCSLVCMEPSANRRFERTGANRRERSLAFAMQKVEGSSPFIRSQKSPGNRGFFFGT